MSLRMRPTKRGTPVFQYSCFVKLISSLVHAYTIRKRSFNKNQRIFSTLKREDWFAATCPTRS